MLQKFLFIGVGGSGGKTLRIIREELELRLASRGITQFPKAWQFLQVDVPVSPDGFDPDLPPQLPAGSYVGLAAPNLSYKNLDELLQKKGDSVVRHTAGWRPEPAEVNVPPAFGAGQYRAVGRTVAAAAMPTLVDRLRRSVQSLSDVSVDAELEGVSRALGAKPSNTSFPPSAVVVSSIAGGSGAGFFLDICDALRMIGSSEKWPGESIGVLYTPDVFGELPAASRGGVNPNALGAVMELLAGYWNNGEPLEDEFAFLETSGVAIAPVDRRGPRYPLLVGRANDKIGFARQNDVYRAVGKSLATWVTDPQVQDSARSYFQGNWQQIANALPNSLRLAEGKENPLSSLGYASVGLGRETFKRYAKQRLARHCVEHVLHFHMHGKSADEIDPDAALEQMANDHRHSFLKQCGLSELGRDENDILDAIRGGLETVRQPALGKLKADIVSSVTRNKTQLDGTKVASAILQQLQDRSHQFLAEQRASDHDNAEKWITDIQARVTEVVAEHVGRLGAQATERLINRSREVLITEVIPELNQEAQDYRRKLAETAKDRVERHFRNFQGALLPDNQLIGKAAKDAADTLWAESEISLYGLAAGLISDLCTSFLDPLTRSLRRAYQALSVEEEGEPGSVSRVKAWPSELLPERMKPAENEVFLDDVDRFSQVFDEKVRSTAGTPDIGGGLRHAVRETISGAFESPDASSKHASDAQRLIEIRKVWVPKHDELGLASGSPESAEFVFHLRASDLEARAAEWTTQKDSALGEYVEESLKDYLAPGKADPSEHEKRLNRFRAGFKQALSTSLPLVTVDAATMFRVHGQKKPDYQYVMSRIPFPVGHPAREVCQQVLLDMGQSEKDIAKKFDESDASRIDISTFLGAPMHALVFSSLISPITAEWAKRKNEGQRGGFWRWRRARPLSAHIPVSPEARHDLLRGWFTARLLGHVQADSYRTEPVKIFTPGDGWVEFPFPFLGKPVTKIQDLAAAVLESLPIALLEASTHGDDPLKAYWRIAELGRLTDRAAAYSEPNEELRKWIDTGSVTTNAPSPDPKNAGSSSGSRQDRLAACEAFVESYLEGYHRLESESLDEENALRLSRAWELRHDILHVLNDLRLILEKERSVDEVGAPG